MQKHAMNWSVVFWTKDETSQLVLPSFEKKAYNFSLKSKGVLFDRIYWINYQHLQHQINIILKYIYCMMYLITMIFLPTLLPWVFSKEKMLFQMNEVVGESLWFQANVTPHLLIYVISFPIRRIWCTHCAFCCFEIFIRWWSIWHVDWLDISIRITLHKCGASCAARRRDA
jgi:hypothetical protein